MRIRSIKPEFWRSPSISALSIEDRLLFIGLWSYVDDNGVGVDEAAFIAADLFAHDLSVSPHDTLMRVQGGLNRLFSGGLIHRYKVDGRGFLHVTTWAEHQRINRPSPGRYPLPDQGVSCEPVSTHGVLTESSVSPHFPEQGNRGTGEQGNRGTVSSSEPADAGRPEVQALLDRLDEHIRANGSKLPTRNKANVNAMRLLLDKDGRTIEEVETVIDWCQADSFWKSNILSAAKLRDKFDQLRLRAANSGGGKVSRVDQNLAEYQRLYGNGEMNVGARSIPAAHARIGA